MSDLISRKAAINALWKALFEYEDKTEKQFQESDELDIYDWFQHRIFVQNMNDLGIQTILNLPSADPVKHGRWDAKWNTLFKAYLPCCSVCSKSAVYTFDYCPNCGAKMDEAEE